MSSCLRCVKLGIGGILTSNPGSRIIATVPKASNTTQCVRNSAALNSLNVVQSNLETEFNSSLHQSNCGNATEHQQHLLDLAASVGASIPFHEGIGASPCYIEKQNEVERLQKMNNLEPTHAVRGNLHCFDPLGLILCPSVYSPEDIQVSDTEVAVSQEDKTNYVKDFRLPPNALWYPRGTRHQGCDMVCSVMYSELEKEVLEKISGFGSYKTEALVSCYEHPKAESTIPENPAFDANLFMKDVCRETGGELHCSVPDAPKPDKVDPTGKPSNEQMTHVYNVLAETLPKLFVLPLDYTIYSQNIVFENRIREKVTVGLLPYVRQVSLLRTVGHLRFAFVSFKILKITKHPEDGTIRVRWQIRGISGLKAMAQFWKIRLWDWKGVQNQMDSWYDGFSTFHVGADGLVKKHIADSMMPDEEQIDVKKGPLAAKLAALLGLAHRPNLGDASTSLPLDLGSLSIMHEEDEEIFSQLMLPLERIQ